MADVAECDFCGGNVFNGAPPTMTCDGCGEEKEFNEHSWRDCGFCYGSALIPAVFTWWECSNCGARNGDG